MTRQLPLQMTTRVRYAADNFLRHHGVAALVESCRTFCAADAFALGFVVGPRRSGKTHLAIHLLDAVGAVARFPRLLEGGEFGQFINSVGVEPFASEDLFIVDDAHTYLETLGAGDSGPFVAFVEKLRLARAGLILLSRQPLEAFRFDEHVRSRLIPGAGLVIGPPADEDMPKLIEMMAKQRGIKLKERKIDYVVRRLGRDIGAIERYFDRVRHLADVLGQAVKFPVLGDAV